jgi:lysophospholipase L1-like esterase
MTDHAHRWLGWPLQAAALLAGAVLAGALLAGCAGPGQIGAALVPPVSPPGSPLTYVAVGASESFGMGATDPTRDAWPQVFYRTALQRAATLVDLGIPGATVADALRYQLPEALRVHPDLVTVWLNVNDLVHGVPPGVYELELTTLLRHLRGGGRTEVLVANTPPLDHLPRLVRCQPFAPSIEGGGCDRSRRLPLSAVDLAVARYNDAIERAAAASGAVLVDLHAWGESVEGSGDISPLMGSDGWHPSTAGYRQIAAVFGQVYAATSRPSN